MRATPLLAVSCLLLVFGPALDARAQAVPVPQSKHQALEDAERSYRQQSIRQQALRHNLAKIDDEIEGLRGSMIKVAREVKKRETEMSALEDRIDALQVERVGLQKKLIKDHKDMAEMASALLRIREVPPEALIARPGAPLQTAQAAMILQGVIAPLKLHAAELNQDLDRLANLEQDLKDRQQVLRESSKKILEEQTKLSELIRRREQAYASVQSDIRVQDEDLKRLAKDAADFKDLIKKLEQRNRDIAAAAIPEASGGLNRGGVRQPPAPVPLDTKALRALGDIQMPISGIIRTAYGASDYLGSASQGIKIEGRAGALVVAPMNGIVRYKGSFKNYGNMIIIEHAKNYHSLVAGLAKIDTVVGQSVMAGEPVGALGAAGAARPALYYELRQNGKPVNPARIFADLG